ncbi:FtsW/RodA/SpoVE family cell cycle protein [Planococcus shixiaomingii]|uniref:FtsW/RodA/SpoVE family cell cycle protein n=1 Tax=Planococcus shixiaomingii TaxID=3058393 RepID=UPI002602346B|nr:FtsW/RodA/SpoVE family cell cycle protein [Planococcus sp. N022]WKA54544.1 FtsW/RodA/SpoVE family cell cycle protein [Planococcus sp. N022]
MGIDKSFDAYIENVCKRIKNKDVHESIKMEISDHLLTMKEEAMNNGLSEEEAVNQALGHMGDVKVLGNQLNKAHKPEIDYKLVLPVIAASCFGLFVMYYLQFHSAFTVMQEMSVFQNSAAFYVLGALLMVSLFVFDYRKLLQYSKQSYIVTMIILTVIVLFGTKVDGVPFLNLGLLHINFIEMTPFLLAISFAGIFKNWNWRDVQKRVYGWGMMSLPVILLLSTGALSSIILIIVVCSAVMIVSKASLKQVIAFAGAASVYPFLQLVLNPQYYALLDPLTIKLSEIGNGMTATPGLISEVHTDFILAYMLYSFGWVAVMAAVGLIGFLIIRLFHVTKLVNSSYEKILVAGLSVIFATQMILGLLTNLGLSSLSGVAIPFMSFGGSHIVLEMISVGLLLIVYRRRKLYNIHQSDLQVSSSR